MSKKARFKGKQARRTSNKSQGFLNDRVAQRNAKVQRFMNTRSAIRQGVLAQRRTNFKGNQFPLITEVARRATVVPILNRAVNPIKQRVAAVPIRTNAGEGNFAAKQSLSISPTPNFVLLTNQSRYNLMDPSGLIKSLSLHQRYWSITAVITHIDAVRVFKSGEGKIQKLTLMDKEGTKIYAIMFNETIDRFHNILQIRKTYIFSNGQVKESNKNFYNVHENFEIILNNISEIQLAINNNIESVSKNLPVIEDIKKNPNSLSDILLLVLNVSEVRMIYRQIDKKKFIKRDLQVIDLRSEVCTFTLWEALATVEGKQLEESKNEKTIILAKNVIGKFFKGFILSATQSTTLEINPNVAASKELLELSNEKIHQHKPSTFDTHLMTNLQNINASEHSSGEVKYYSTRVVIKGLDQEGNIWYNSCSTCKSKVYIVDDIAKCSKCSKEKVDYSLRYLIKLRVEDDTSSAIFTMFDSEVEHIIGMPVTKLEKIKASNIEDYNNIITNICEKKLIFSVKVQDKIYGNQTFRYITVQSIKEDYDEVIAIEP